MNSENNEILSQILVDLNVGWWKINYTTQQMYVSDLTKDLLKLQSNDLFLDDFIKMVRNDYRQSLLQKKRTEDNVGTTRTFPLSSPGNEEIWVSSKYIGQKYNNQQEEIATGYFQVIPNPETASPEKGASLRLNNLLYQLNSVSQILLSFLKTDSTEAVINQILTDILKQFKAGRAYIFEYNWENDTQSCTYEIVDENINPEIDILTDLPIAHNNWWTDQLLSGNSIILSDIEDLPDVALEAKELLRVQDIKSLFVIPLVSKNGVWGYVGIDVVDGYYDWSEDDKLWFHSIANIISIFVELHRSEKNALQDKELSQKMHEELDRSEKILRNIYDNLPVGIELYDKNGVLVDMNNSDVKMFGLTQKEEALGLNLFDNPNIPKQTIDLLQNQQPTSFRISYSFDILGSYYTSGKSGIIEIYTKANPLYDNKGNLINYLFINIDNTEINQAYSRIAEFESSFSIISKYGKIGYCKFDLLTRNGGGVPQWYYNLGEEPNTPLNQIIGVYNHLHDEDREKLFAHIRRVKADEINGFTEDLRVYHKDGTQSWTQVNVLKNPDNTDPSKLEMLCVNYDITNLKETEKKLIEAKEKAEVSDRLKSAFVANMSHEIRTPLNAIVGFSGLLADTEEEEEKKAYVNIIQENNDMLLQLISDILDLSKIEAGTLDFTYGEVDVNALCTEIINTYKMKAENTPVKILYGKHMASCYINSDKNRLMQVIGNFMNNAMKFTPEGSITVGYEMVGKDKIKFFVEDTGCGIAEDKQDSIFQRFVKLNNFVQGTGLGLSICSSIVEQMGGEIGVTSTEGSGACFWFTHPYTAAGNEEEIIQAVEIETESIANIEEDINTEEGKAIILVAEDTDSNYLLIKNIIRDRYTLIHAVNGVEALETWKNNHVDLILMDINMPKMDGITATKEIRKKDSKLPIIAATAYAFDGDRQKALEAGCTDYIAKPIKPKELLGMISKYL
ncbi:response regulator [Bacteroides sp. 51]|uniref:response regulator n=1 Tax=Bacteroides sp. 51 TaxID=2302938 RepID=UPI0013D2C176|nr:response regulator [Bacteroides sp. 51]NDV84570.1 response regulator [Bacteroides sp. 51]